MIADFEGTRFPLTGDEEMHSRRKPEAGQGFERTLLWKRIVREKSVFVGEESTFGVHQDIKCPLIESASEFQGVHLGVLVNVIFARITKLVIELTALLC